MFLYQRQHLGFGLQVRTASYTGSLNAWTNFNVCTFSKFIQRNTELIIRNLDFKIFFFSFIREYFIVYQHCTTTEIFSYQNYEQ